MDTVGDAGGLAAADEEGAEPGVTGSLEVQDWVITDVQNELGFQVQSRGGGPEYAGIRFGGADFAGDGHGAEEWVKAESAEQWPQAVIPVGKHGGSDAFAMQGCEGGDDIGVHQPGLGIGESLVELRKERLARRGINEIAEDVVDEFGPVSGGVERTGVCAAGGAEAAVDQLGVEWRSTEVGSRISVDVTH